MRRDHETTLDVGAALIQAVADLDDEPPEQAAVAAASLAMLAQQADDQDPELHIAIGKLLALVKGPSHISIQKNACVALVAIVQAGTNCWQLAISQGAMALAIDLLAGQAADSALRLNAVVLAGALIEGGASGPREFYSARGAQALLPLLAASWEGPLLEAAVDTVCKLASEVDARPQLLEQDVLPRLGRLLGLRDGEVVVRALMAMAMLLGNNRVGLRELARSAAVVKQLAALMRSKEDPDSRQIAAGIFGAMAEDEEARRQVAASLGRASNS